MSREPNKLECRDMFNNITSGNLSGLMSLVASGLNANCHNVYYNSYTPLYGAVMFNKFDAVKFLLNNGADVNFRSGNGASALCSASQSGNMEIFNYLLSFNADPNIASKSGLSPLLQASAAGNLEMVNNLLARGADAGAKMVNGDTALHLAASARATDVIRSLVAANPSIVSATNSYGKTALDNHIINGYDYASQQKIEAMLLARPTDTRLIEGVAHARKTVETMKTLLELGTTCDSSCMTRLKQNPDLANTIKLYGDTHSHDGDSTGL